MIGDVADLFGGAPLDIVQEQGLTFVTPDLPEQRLHISAGPRLSGFRCRGRIHFLTRLKRNDLTAAKPINHQILNTSEQRGLRWNLTVAAVQIEPSFLSDIFRIFSVMH